MNLCNGCKRDFSGVTTFDEHQRWDSKNARNPVVCLDPADLGMTTNERGAWGRPGTVTINRDYVPAAERPAHEFDVTCKVCGTIFQRPRKRGRPPTKCEACR